MRKCHPQLLRQLRVLPAEGVSNRIHVFQIKIHLLDYAMQYVLRLFCLKGYLSAEAFSQDYVEDHSISWKMFGKQLVDYGYKVHTRSDATLFLVLDLVYDRGCLQYQLEDLLVDSLPGITIAQSIPNGPRK